MKRVVFFVLGVLGPGGQQRLLLSILRGLNRDRWTPVVVGTQTGAFVDELATQCDVHVLDPGGPAHVRRLPAMLRLLDQYRPAVVHSMLSTGNTWGRLAVAVGPKPRPAVVMQEGNVDTWKTPAHRVIDRVLLGVTDAAVGNSHLVSRYMMDVDRVPPHMMHTIPNGIDLQRAQSALGESPEERRRRRGELGLGDDHLVVGNVGRFDPVKGLDVLLDTFADLHRRLPNARLLRFAQPPLSNELEFAEQWERDLVRRGLTDTVITVIDEPYTGDVSSVFGLCDAVIQSSWREGLPTVLMEAMAMERPIVATAAGGTSELIQQLRTGWIVDPGDWRGLADGLMYACSRPREARAWARAGRHLIETEYSESLLVERTTQLYDRLLDARGVPA